MAFDVSSAFRKHPFRYSALAAAGLLLTATTTHAGFEWVPAPKTEKQALPSAPPSPPAAVEAAPMATPPAQELLLPEDQALSPMPGSEPAPQNVLVAPADAATAEVAPAEPVIQTKSFEAPAPVEAPAQAAMDAQILVPVKTHIVMPDDAPDSARASLPESSAPSAPAALVPAAAQPAEPVVTAPVPDAVAAPESAPAEVTATLPPERAAAPESFAVIEGFGSDMPLALALREIVPDGYAYSFGIGVNPGVPVSWNGGKPWPEVISEMIAPMTLRAEMRGNVVVIRSNRQSSAEQPTMPAAETPQTANIENAATDAVEPASGKDGAKDEEFSADMYSIRRQIINDPGASATEQPSETLDMIKELGLGENGAPQPLLPPEAQPTDAQQMEAEEKQSLGDENVEDGGAQTQQEIAMNITDPAPAEATDVPLEIRSLWEAQKGDSLKRTLDEWTKKVNYQLVWESSHDYTIGSDILVTGDFQRAVKTVFAQGLGDEATPLMTFVAATSKGQPGRIIIQDGKAG